MNEQSLYAKRRTRLLGHASHHALISLHTQQRLRQIRERKARMEREAELAKRFGFTISEAHKAVGEAILSASNRTSELTR